MSKKIYEEKTYEDVLSYIARCVTAYLQVHSPEHKLIYINTPVYALCLVNKDESLASLAEQINTYIQFNPKYVFKSAHELYEAYHQLAIGNAMRTNEMGLFKKSIDELLVEIDLHNIK